MGHKTRRLLILVNYLEFLHLTQKSINFYIFKKYSLKLYPAYFKKKHFDYGFS